MDLLSQLATVALDESRVLGRLARLVEEADCMPGSVVITADQLSFDTNALSRCVPEVTSWAKGQGLQIAFLLRLQKHSPCHISSVRISWH